MDSIGWTEVLNKRSTDHLLEKIHLYYLTDIFKFSISEYFL